MVASRSSKPLSKEQLEAACSRIDSQLATAGSSAGKLEERVQEYEELKGILQELPEKVRHPIMVPYGPLAFFPGYLEHTNEVLTQLSSEWFVLRTNKAALGLAERRQARLRKEKAGVTKEQRDLNLMRGLTLGEEAAVGGGATIRRDESGFVDIREPFNEAERAAEQPPPASSSSGARAPPEAVQQGDAGDVLKRLRELERLEEEEELDAPAELDEMAELDSVMAQAEAGTLPGVAEAAPSERAQKAARAGPELHSPADLFARMQRVEEEASRTTDRGVGPPAAAAVAAAAAPATGRAGMGSFEDFAATMQQPRGQAAVFAPPSRAPEAPQRGDPGSGGVLERSAPAVAESAASASAGAASEEPPKRVSKFKADRLARR